MWRRGVLRDSHTLTHRTSDDRLTGLRCVCIVGGMTNNELGDQVHDNIRERRTRQLTDLRSRLKRAESNLNFAQADFDDAEERLEIATEDLHAHQQVVEDLSDMIGVLERETE